MYFKFRVAISMGDEKDIKQPRTDCVQKGYRERMIVDFAPVIVFFNHRCLLILQKKQ